MPEPQQETWLRLVVLTVIVLAAAAGLAAFKSSAFATRAQIFAGPGGPAMAGLPGGEHEKG